MTQNPHRDGASNEDPNPERSTGLQPGGSVDPGDTPPDSGSMSGAAPDVRKDTPNTGPVSGNRTPMIIALVAIGVVVLMVALLSGASFFASD